MASAGSDRRPTVADFSAATGFRADSSLCGSAFMEDQPVEIVGEVGERQFRFGSRQTDGANEQAEPVLLMGEDMLDCRPD